MTNLDPMLIAGDNIADLLAAIHRVRDLHKSYQVAGDLYCVECDEAREWPCDTIRALDGYGD